MGKLQHESKSVDPKAIQSVSAQLKMGAEGLNLTGGADRLMEGDFSYNVSRWKPKVSYDVSEEVGVPRVAGMRRGLHSLDGKARNEWDISLNEGVPTDLVVQMGAGERPGSGQPHP